MRCTIYCTICCFEFGLAAIWLTRRQCTQVSALMHLLEMCMQNGLAGQVGV